MEKSGMVLGRPHLASACLMAIASAIAITEYVLYKPIMLPEDIDGEYLSSDDEPSVESEESSKVPDAGARQSNKTSSVFTNGQEVTIQKGDTLASVLDNLGFDKTEIYLATKSLSKIFNLRNLKAGQKILVKGTHDKAGDAILKKIEIKPDYKTRIIVSKTDTGYNADKFDIPIKKVVRSVSGTMAPREPGGSLRKYGIKECVATDALRGLAQIVNIRSSRSPVEFEFLYQEYYDEEGNVARNPELLYASVFINGTIKRIYKFQQGGSSEFVDSKGTLLRTLSTRGSMLAQPLSRMKITSRFGYRVHPISGKMRGHTGVDISAAVGTPIRAAASGQVMKATQFSGYGRYVNIKHTAAISTAYGHLSRIVVRRGQHVAKGQIIGYTGNSGYSTGPHLHYEVIKHGHPINPLGYVKQEPQKLSSDRMYKFEQFKKEINLQIVGLTSSKDKLTKGNRY